MVDTLGVIMLVLTVIACYVVIKTYEVLDKLVVL